MEEIMINAIVSIVAAVITGVIAYKATVAGVDKSLKQEREIENKKIEEERFRLRPKFSIKKADLTNAEDSSILKIFISLLKGYIKKGRYYFIHDEKSLNENDHISYDFILRNVGLSDANSIWIASAHHKSICIMDYNEKEIITNNFFGHYSYCYDNVTPPQTEIHLRFLAHKNIGKNPFSADIVILFQDEYGNYWEQPFVFPEDKLYEAKKISRNEFKDTIDYGDMLERMDDPYRSGEGLRYLDQSDILKIDEEIVERQNNTNGF